MSRDWLSNVKQRLTFLVQRFLSRTFWMTSLSFHFCSLCPLWERVRLFISTFYILLLIRMFCVKITSNLYINAWGKIHTLYKIFILNAVKQTDTRHDVIRKTYLSFNLRWAIRYNLTEKRTQTISILLETRKILKFELER